MAEEMLEGRLSQESGCSVLFPGLPPPPGTPYKLGAGPTHFPPGPHSLLGMPKKFQGENSKSAAARARKAEAKAAADARKQQELEDAYWKDEDKHVMRKEQRKVGAPGVQPLRPQTRTQIPETQARCAARRCPADGSRDRAQRRLGVPSEPFSFSDTSRGVGARVDPNLCGLWALGGSAAWW